MGRQIDDIIKALPPKRRTKIVKKSENLAQEMIAYADSLADVRRVFRKTQAEVGVNMSLAQNAISQLEARKDMRISTLARYVGALGGELDLIIRSKDGSEVVFRSSAIAKRPPKHAKASSAKKRELYSEVMEGMGALSKSRERRPAKARSVNKGGRART